MPHNVVLVFGAGATKACGGPLTNEILPQALRHRQSIEREGFIGLVEEFLIDCFHLPPAARNRKDDDYPPLPLLLALLDIAIDKKHGFGPDWPGERLVHVRDAIDYLIFALLEHRLRRLKHNYYLDLLRIVRQETHSEPRVVSLNYDIIVDNALVMATGSFPDYGADIVTKAYGHSLKSGMLLKLHGSLNWIYCPGCQRLELGVSSSGRTVKVLDALYRENPLEPHYGCHGRPCPSCGAFARPVLITPTHLKDYRNPHISRVWYEAERLLREADSVIFVGYSLPADDVDVVYMLKRSLAHLKPSQITVVGAADPLGRSLRDHPTGSRYRSLFGDGLDWHPEGFEAWVEARLNSISILPSGFR